MIHIPAETPNTVEAVRDCLDEQASEGRGMTTVKLDHEEKQRQAEGSTPFVPSPFDEQLIELRTIRPAEFEKFSPASRLALQYYEVAKRRTGQAEMTA